MNKVLTIASVLAMSVPQASNATELSTLVGVDRATSSKLFGLSIAVPVFKYGRIIQSVGIMTKRNLASQPVFFGEVAIGTRVEVPWFYGQFSQGIAFISDTMPGLNTNYQLPTTASVGLRTGKVYLGMTFKHFSNGSTNWKNSGRNFYCAEFGGSF